MSVEYADTITENIRDYLQVDQNYRITSPFEEIVH